MYRLWAGGKRIIVIFNFTTNSMSYHFAMRAYNSIDNDKRVVYIIFGLIYEKPLSHKSGYDTHDNKDHRHDIKNYTCVI